ncbi:serine-threonine protein kinase [Streptomyces tsukubensis]|uniref:serine-threonine protein kinase n=1 Tax=Streptomyces tsukubensis TaxID=83656 RepID=UPI001D0424B8|nr:serine-threonine protein kinase [Streptomyces tsukubensis]
METAARGGAPSWTPSFDSEGNPDTPEADRLTAEAAGSGITDLVVFAHPWHNDPDLAAALHNRFLSLVGEEAGPGFALGYAGVCWPSMRFGGEPEPGLALDGSTAAGPSLDESTRSALAGVFPGCEQIVDEAADLLRGGRESKSALDDFGRLVRRLVEVRLEGTRAAFASDTEEEHGMPQSDPGMLFDDAASVCRGFTDALMETGAPATKDAVASEALGPLWHGARELLRQAVYYALKRRAGAVGQLGLGPLLGRVAREAPRVRVHLVGHSSGARLVAFALRGLPSGVETVASVTLLQPAFSHYAFASHMPYQSRGGGVLREQARRVAGPVVCATSRHDTELRVFYPLASRMGGDVSGLMGPGHKWGALGYNGFQAVEGTRHLSLESALKEGLGGGGCVSVDASAVVREGPSPVGAHHDICHRELAALVATAGRFGRAAATKGT